MQAAIIENGVVTNLVEVDHLDALPDLIDGAGAHIGDAWDGQTFLPPVPVRVAGPLTVDDYRAAIQRMLDDKVKERRYYDIVSACTYGNSTNPVFKAEAEACIVWRDAVWAKAYEMLDQVESGTALQPTIPGLLAMLPKLTWPT